MSAAIVITCQDIDYFKKPSGVVWGALGSIPAPGSAVGFAVAGPLSDNTGRCDSVILGCLFWLIGTQIRIVCKKYGWLITCGTAYCRHHHVAGSCRSSRDSKKGGVRILQQLAIEFVVLTSMPCLVSLMESSSTRE